MHRFDNALFILEYPFTDEDPNSFSTWALRVKKMFFEKKYHETKADILIGSLLWYWDKTMRETSLGKIISGKESKELSCFSRLRESLDLEKFRRFILHDWINESIESTEQIWESRLPFGEIHSFIARSVNREILLESTGIDQIKEEILIRWFFLSGDLYQNILEIPNSVIDNSSCLYKQLQELIENRPDFNYRIETANFLLNLRAICPVISEDIFIALRGLEFEAMANRDTRLSDYYLSLINHPVWMNLGLVNQPAQGNKC